jgi:hypothetical protein
MEQEDQNTDARPGSHFVVTIDIKQVILEIVNPRSVVPESRRTIDDTLHVVVRASTLPEAIAKVNAIMAAS